MAELPIEKAADELDPDGAVARLLFDDSADASRDWIEANLTVPTELGQIVRMRLYPQQYQMLLDETGRDVTVKGRQTRASSLKMAANFRRMVTGQLWGATCIIGAQDDATTAIFRARIRHHLYNDLVANKGFKYDIGLDNNDELVLKGLDNRFLFISGEQRVVGRGFAAQLVHLSEFAHWKDTALELVGGILPAVPGAPAGRIDMESTPKGEQGAFYDYAAAAKPLNPKGLWSVHLYPWWMEPRYRVSDNPRSGCDIIMSPNELRDRLNTLMPSEHESKLMQGDNFDGTKLTSEQILWRQLKKIEQDRTQAPFLQEYPEDLDTCWLGVQGKFFDTPDNIDHLEYYRDVRRQPVKTFEKLTYRGDEVSFFGSNLAVWEFPDQNDTYVGGFDTAGGGLGKDVDWSVFYVISVKKEKVVARLRVQTSPKTFAGMIAAVATWYKNALINGERSHHGAAVFEELRDLSYANIYYHTDPMKPPSPKERLQPGMYPTQANRQSVLEKLKTGITNHAIESFCPELVREMNVFTWQKVANRLKAAAIDLVGQHDDCIFAVAYCWYIIDKARNRLRAHQRQEEERVIRIGALGRVIRRDDGTMPDNQKLWFGV